jgi:hypothetical protein
MTRSRILKAAQPAPTPAPTGHRTSAAKRVAALLSRLQVAGSALGSRLAAQCKAAAASRSKAPPPVITLPGPGGLTRKGHPANNLPQRIALAVAIITVPAMAAPGEYAVFSAPQAAIMPDPLALAAARALPFERPGMSFPGSAFYFLEDPPGEALIALPTADPLELGAEAGRELGEFINTGPMAKPFFSSGAGISHARALNCLAQAVWYEAATESEAGQRAVAQVVLNRVAHPSWPASVCGVVYQGSDRQTGCQFTFTCDGSLARRASGASWAQAQAIAAEALTGNVYAPVGHATHYHTLWVNPYWAGSLDHVGTIGAQRFYRNRGRAGEKSAFTIAYSGAEPIVSGRTAPRDSTPVLAALPDSTAQASMVVTGNAAAKGAKRRTGKGQADPLAAPLSDNPEVANSGQVRDEFASAGQWKPDADRTPLAKPAQ